MKKTHESKKAPLFNKKKVLPLDRIGGDKIHRITIAAPHDVTTPTSAGKVGTTNGLGVTATFSEPRETTADGNTH